MGEYGNPWGPDMNDPSLPHLVALQQREEEDVYEEPIIQVPVKVTEFCAEPLNVHVLPAREAIMRNFIIAPGQITQILGRDLRRSSAKVWAVTSGAETANVVIGTNLGEVEQGTAALLPVVLDDLSITPPFVLAMNHVKEMWVRNTHTDPVIVSLVAEYWAD